jgi:hypothetical protein
MLLEELGLLSTVQLSDDTPAAYPVRRWTATALGRRADPAALLEAHRRAAQHWRWQVKALPLSGTKNAISSHSPQLASPSTGNAWRREFFARPAEHLEEEHVQAVLKLMEMAASSTENGNSENNPG